MPTRSLLDTGIHLFNQEKYFEAHEVWEDLWRATTGGDRKFYQGLIHAAVGLYHLGRRNPTGAQRQLGKSLANLATYPPDCCGIDNTGLQHQLQQVLAAMAPREVQIRRIRS